MTAARETIKVRRQLSAWGAWFVMQRTRSCWKVSTCCREIDSGSSDNSPRNAMSVRADASKTSFNARAPAQFLAHCTISDRSREATPDALSELTLPDIGLNRALGPRAQNGSRQRRPGKRA